MATVRDVAALAGVSVATVSRVMTGSARVAKETELKVRSVIQELGYVPNRPVSRQKEKKSQLLAVILPNISNPYFAELLDIIERESTLHGYSILFFNSRNSALQERICLDACQRHQVDGIFIVPSELCPEQFAQLKKQPCPVVILTQVVPGITSVLVDHVEGGAMVAEHLVRSGHTHIGFLGQTDASEQKLVGFKNKLAELGYPLQDEHIIAIPEGRFDNVESWINDYLDRHIRLPVSAIFAFNDIAALQMIEGLTQRGYRVPEDVVVVGFDNTLLSRVMGITSIAQPMQEIGRLAFQEMQTRQESGQESLETVHLLLSPRLVTRNSSLKVTKIPG